MLKDFRGILVSDFYTAYDSIGCLQQKCLIHLIRDLNDDVLKHPYDEELKSIVRNFAALLKPIIQTIDRRELKQRFLAKHRIEVDRFYRDLSKQDYQSERAQKCKKRFEKNRDKLFTFLNYDDIPWNNNNAEHAVKAFAKIRDIVRGTFTARTVRNNLVLLSICQTCKYSGVDFFEFMRSGELDLYTALERQRPFGGSKHSFASKIGSGQIKSEAVSDVQAG
jgi:Transposase IS66 family